MVALWPRTVGKSLGSTEQKGVHYDVYQRAQVLEAVLAFPAGWSPLRTRKSGGVLFKYGPELGSTKAKARRNSCRGCLVGHVNLRGKTQTDDNLVGDLAMSVDEADAVLARFGYVDREVALA